MAGQTQTRRAGRERERALAELATRQRGVVARAQMLALGFGLDAIEGRLNLHRLVHVHRTVYAVGHGHLARRDRMAAAVLACGDGALLSHRSAAELWGIGGRAGSVVDVNAPRGRQGLPRRTGIRLHRSKIDAEDWADQAGIPVTTVARTLFDLAEVVERTRLERAWEEADRLGLLQIGAVEGVCERGRGRHALRPIRRLLADSRYVPVTRSPLEDRFVAFCREHRLPPPATNTSVLGFEVDALWPDVRLIVELDGFAYHHHRAAFERDRARDAALQAAGYKVIRLTHRRLEDDATTVADEIRQLLS